MIALRAYGLGVAAAEQEERARPRRFPALDPEPPPRPWWRRLARAAVVVAAAAAVLAGVAFWPSSSGARRPAGVPPLPAVAGGGHVVVQTSDGYLALADPDGTHYTKLAVPGLLPGGPITPAAALDGRYLSTLDQVIAISGGRPTAAHDTGLDANSDAPAVPGPFAAHDRVLVAVENPSGFQSTTAPIVAQDLASGRRANLGAGDNVAGDPAAEGAFVSVAAPVQPSATVPTESLSPDAGVELRDAGRPTVRLATAAALNLVLGQAPGLPVELRPCPDPSGDKVAVEVYLVNGGPTGGVVVLSRSGRVLGSVQAAFGPPIGQPVVWDPAGQSIAFTAKGASGPELSTWAIGRRDPDRCLPRPRLQLRTVPVVTERAGGTVPGLPPARPNATAVGDRDHEHSGGPDDACGRTR